MARKSRNLDATDSGATCLSLRQLTGEVGGGRRRLRQRWRPLDVERLRVRQQRRRDGFPRDLALIAEHNAAASCAAMAS
jgi:hypothetical protein